MPGGQVQITWKKLSQGNCPINLKSVLESFVTIKAESAPMVASLSTHVLEPRLNISVCSDANVVQNTTNAMARLCAR
jgi:hypothetical protein